MFRRDRGALRPLRGQLRTGAERLLLDPVQVVIVGAGPEADRLEATAVAGFAVNKTVMRIAARSACGGRSSGSAGGDAVAGAASRRSRGMGAGLQGRTCLPPVTSGRFDDGFGRLRFVLSPVPKCEGRGGTLLSG